MSALCEVVETPEALQHLLELRYIGGRNGDLHDYERTLAVRTDFHYPAHISHPFADAGKSYSSPGSRFLELLQHHRRYAAATVSHLKRDFAIAKGQTYLRARTLGVTMDIGERFLKNAKEGNFDFLRQLRKTGWQVGGNCNPATLGKTLNVPGGGGKKTDFVQ
jgi:hypothetical protein